MVKYRCPVCNKPLTKKEFGAALGILEEKDAHLKHLQNELDKQIKDLPKKIEKARIAAREKEKRSAARLMRGQKAKIARLQERIGQLERE